MAKTETFGRCLRPTLARLRRSTAYGVLGLAAIAIAGCSNHPSYQTAKDTKTGAGNTSCWTMGVAAEWRSRRA